MAALNCMKYPLCGRQRRAGDKRQHGYDDVDGPYAWVVALAAFFGHVFIFGILWSSGVFYDLFRELFDGPSWMLSLISTLSTAFTYGFSKYMASVSIWLQYGFSKYMDSIIIWIP